MSANSRPVVPVALALVVFFPILLPGLLGPYGIFIDELYYLSCSERPAWGTWTTRHSWAVRVPLHVGCSVVVGVAHTLLMWGSRSLLMPLLGWGSCDYGLMRYRFLMEYRKQVLIYVRLSRRYRAGLLGEEA